MVSREEAIQGRRYYCSWATGQHVRGHASARRAHASRKQRERAVKSYSHRRGAANEAVDIIINSDNSKNNGGDDDGDK